MQPTFTQVPPKSFRSITAVRRPSFVSRAANEGPDWPVPMTIASNFWLMFWCLLGVKS